MTKDNRTELRKSCEKYRIPIEVEAQLQGLVEDLRLYKKTVMIPKQKTKKQRVEQLRQIKELASALKQAFMGLTYEDRWALDEEYRRRPDTPGRVICLDAVTRVRFVERSTVDPQYFTLPEKVIPDIENAVVNVVQRMIIKYDGKTERRADFIKHIAIILKPTNIKPSKNGKFFAVSEAVFVDAGVTLSGNEIVHFLQNTRPQLRTLGCCL